MKTIAALLIHLLWLTDALAQSWTELATPVVDQQWVRPAQGVPAQPVWGHAHGIRVGLAPMPGPRGLLRIYAPYLGHKVERVINFIAFEPIVRGQEHRSLSELEMSGLDNVRGKRFWSGNDSLSTMPVSPIMPANGIVEKNNGQETLTVFVFSEDFESGAQVYTRLRFYAHKPYEVEITTYASPMSKALDYFIVTATMGNYARLRNLYLQSGITHSHSLWPDYDGNAFTPHAHFPVQQMVVSSEGYPYFIAAPDEVDPSQATYAADTNEHWKYYGKKATQYWYVPGYDVQLEGLVNGRYTYWASKSPIPGGISYENFELKAPFRNGYRFVFGVSPLSPNSFIQQVKK